MMISYDGKCGKRFLVKDEHARQPGICPACRREFRFPVLFQGSDESTDPIPMALTRIVTDEGLRPDRPKAVEPTVEEKTQRPFWKDPIVVIGWGTPILALVVFFSYLAWPEPSWVGERVIQKHRHLTLQVGSETVDRKDRLCVYIVKQTNGALVQVEGTERKIPGWAPASEFVRVEQGVRYFSDQIRANPNDGFLYAMRGFVRYLARYDMKPGYLARNEMNTDLALHDCDEAIRLDPLYVATYVTRATLRSSKGEYDRAIEDFDAAIRLDPTNAYVFFDRSFAWTGEGRDDRAIADLSEALRLDPEFYFAISMRALLWEKLRNYKMAIADYTECIRLASAHGEPRSSLFCQREKARYFERQYDAAIADYSEAIRLDPGYARAIDGRGDTWTGKREYDKAIGDYNEAIRLDPKNAGVYRSRGSAWKEKKEYDKAIDDLSKAIGLNPHDAWAYVFRGEVWVSRQKYGSALDDYNEAIRLDPKNVWAYVFRGEVWVRDREYDRALDSFNEAIRLDPKNAWAYVCRAGTWRARGEYDKATADEEMAAALKRE